MSNTWFKREERWRVTFIMVENETETDIVLIKKEHRRFIQNVKAIIGEFKHALLIAEIEKRKIRNVVRSTERRKITLVKEVKIRKRFEEKVTKLVDVAAPNL